MWAAAALPMAFAAWVVVPVIEDSLGSQGLLKALVLALTAGMIWQSMLVATLVGIEQRSLRWETLRRALWLQGPRSPKTGRPRGRLWWLLPPLAALFAVGEMIPALPHPDGRDFGLILESDAGQAFFSGNWGWFALVVVMFVFNTALGEELLFRGYLLPRMEGAFGQRAWLANGVLFGLPPARPMGHSGHATDRHIRDRIPNAALPQRLDRHHRPQRTKRGAHDHSVGAGPGLMGVDQLVV